MKVTLRQKKAANNKLSLYLDYYPPIKDPNTGKDKRREYLKLYVFEKPKTTTERKHNKETKSLAENIRAKRQIAIQNSSYDFLGDEKKNIDFLMYFKKVVEYRKNNTSKGNYTNWLSSYKYLHKFSNGQLLIKDLDDLLIKRFKDYLLNTESMKSNGTKLSVNSAHSYFNKFRSAVKQAFEEKLIHENHAKRVKGITPTSTKREFLTIEEIQKLANTECEYPLLKRAALFSAFTGLRWSDVLGLDWSDLNYSKDRGHYLDFTQKKTQSHEIHPISEQARTFLGKSKDNEERIFKGLKYSAWNNLKIKEWVLRAEIPKKITFHCFRHTYATLLLSNGIDIYTVSKMLGHKHLKTTEIYVKVMDSKKVNAANAIPTIHL